jgi:hypothetical protein
MSNPRGPQVPETAAPGLGGIEHPSAIPGLVTQLCLSPQCGFASSARSKPLPMDLVERKLARIVEVADQVWG